ncbi:MAG: PilX N-terminal domain-containing pilus assembly protein [Gammaproteobacteria bacterium]
MRHYQASPTLSRQRGMVLIVALIILMVLTILGVSGMTTTSLQERMAANEHDRQIAFQTAEAALRTGENYIQSNSMDPSMFNSTCTGGSGGLCDCSDKTNGCPIYWSDQSLDVWNSANTNKHVTVQTAFSQVAAQPMYIIEFLGWVNPPGATPGTLPGPGKGDPMMFRVTALGTGQSPNAKVMLQSTYKK